MDHYHDITNGLDEHAFHVVKERFKYLASLPVLHTACGSPWSTYVDVMESWVKHLYSPQVPGDKYAENKCGTVGCVAGETVIAHMFGTHHPIDKLPPFAHTPIEPMAARILGITQEQRSQLFFESAWPSVVYPSGNWSKELRTEIGGYTTRYQSLNAYPVYMQYRIMTFALDLFFHFCCDVADKTMKFRELRTHHDVVQKAIRFRDAYEFDRLNTEWRNTFGISWRYEPTDDRDGICMGTPYDANRPVEMYGDYSEISNDN